MEGPPTGGDFGGGEMMGGPPPENQPVEDTLLSIAEEAIDTLLQQEMGADPESADALQVAQDAIDQASGIEAEEPLAGEGPPPEGPPPDDERPDEGFGGPPSSDEGDDEGFPPKESRRRQAGDHQVSIPLSAEEYDQLPTFDEFEEERRRTHPGEYTEEYITDPSKRIPPGGPPGIHKHQGATSKWQWQPSPEAAPDELGRYNEFVTPPGEDGKYLHSYQGDDGYHWGIYDLPTGDCLVAGGPHGRMTDAQFAAERHYNGIG